MRFVPYRDSRSFRTETPARRRSAVRHDRSDEPVPRSGGTWPIIHEGRELASFFGPGRASLAGSIAAVAAATKIEIEICYLHERVWAVLPWGDR